MNMHICFVNRSEWPLWGGELLLGWLAIFLYGPCLLSVLISYGYIYIIARNHARAIYSVEVSLHNGSTCEVGLKNDLCYDCNFLTIPISKLFLNKLL